MNRFEKRIYAELTNGKAKSRRSIRRFTTGAERSSVKALNRQLNQAARQEAQDEAGEVTEI